MSTQSKVEVTTTRIPEPGLKESVHYKLTIGDYWMEVRAASSAGCAYMTDWLLPKKSPPLVSRLIAAAVTQAKPHKRMLRITVPLVDMQLLTALRDADFRSTMVHGWRGTVEMTKNLT